MPYTPLNPLPGALTASPWETDPEGPGKRFVHSEHTHIYKFSALIQTHAMAMHAYTCMSTRVKGPHSF